jgi:hypothetical protein
LDFSNEGEGWGRVAQIHNTHVKVVSEFVDDKKKICLRSGKTFSTTRKILVGCEALTAVVMKNSEI